MNKIENAIEVNNLSKSFKEVKAVDNLNLSIKKGELFSLLGVNGAGKTTTIKILTGLIKADQGNAFINGINISDSSYKQYINVSPQETAIALNLTTIENLYFMADIYQIRNKDEVINELIKNFKLEKIINKKTKKLSGGWQRRLSIAMALINDPDILFLDEPTLGLDVIARRELWSIIKSLKGKKTIILTTHYMEEAEALSDQIGIMANGKLIITGTSQELIKLAKVNNFEDAFIKLAGGIL